MARETMREIMANVTYDKSAIRPKFIAPNTVVYYRDGCKVMRLHQTDIMVWSADGATVKLYTGGWQTVTTKERLNRFAPGHGRIFSDKGVWYIAPGVVFYEGIELNATTGAICDMEKAARKAAKTGADIAAKKKLIAKFMKQFHALDRIPEPCAGDCWLCSMFDAAKLAPKSNGDYLPHASGGKVSDPDHLVSHLKEGYLHGSLIVNAMRWAGYADQGIGIWYGMVNRDKASGRYDPRNTLARTLRRFLSSQLGLAT